MWLCLLGWIPTSTALPRGQHAAPIDCSFTGLWVSFFNIGVCSGVVQDNGGSQERKVPAQHGTNPTFFLPYSPSHLCVVITLCRKSKERDFVAACHLKPHSQPHIHHTVTRSNASHGTASYLPVYRVRICLPIFEVYGKSFSSQPQPPFCTCSICAEHH